jgi:hypothetical protein
MSALDLAGPLLFADSVKDEEHNQMTALGGRLPRWFLLLLIAVVGLFLIGLPEFANTHGYDVVAREVGAALIIVMMLAITIDRWIKADLLQDAVKTTLEAVVYKDFLVELRRLFSYEFICEGHDMELGIEIIDDEHVRVRSTVSRRLRNITATPKRLQAMTHIDEFGVSDGLPSKIEECYIVKGDLRIDAPAPFYPNPYSIRAETKYVEVGPNEVATLVTKQYEIRYKNDHSVGTYLSPTRNPLVRVTIPDSRPATASGVFSTRRQRARRWRN